MKNQLFLFVFSLMILMGCNDKKMSSKQNDTYEKSKMTIEEIEKKTPLKFLKVETKDKKNLIGQTVLKGEIFNKASVVSYKDIAIHISFYSKTNALLEEDEEVIYETIEPGKSAAFKSKYYAPKGTEDVKIKITAAKSAD